MSKNIAETIFDEINKRTAAHSVANVLTEEQLHNQLKNAADSMLSERLFHDIEEFVPASETSSTLKLTPEQAKEKRSTLKQLLG